MLTSSLQWWVHVLWLSLGRGFIKLLWVLFGSSVLRQIREFWGVEEAHCQMPSTQNIFLHHSGVFWTFSLTMARLWEAKLFGSAIKSLHLLVASVPVWLHPSHDVQILCLFYRKALGEKGQRKPRSQIWTESRWIGDSEQNLGGVWGEGF